MCPTEAAEYLEEHLKWRCADDCNLMSWTSSVLFALQYALYRHEMTRCELSNINILVVDTRAFKRGVFARDVDALKAFRGATDSKEFDRLHKWRVDGRFYYGEYLSQGRVPIDPERSW